jgi:dTDP-4-dehydrorhamnose reductase
MKVLVTGFSGFVAGSILCQAPDHWELHAMGRSTAPEDSKSIRYHQVDMLEKDSMSNMMETIQPEVVIHTAAIANIDFCESNRAMAQAVNVSATEHIAGLCKKQGAKMVFCSTDTVFNGKKPFYSEEDIPFPVNYYADTKIRAEQKVLSADKRNIVARLALVMGLPLMHKGNSFLADMIAKLGKGETMKFAVNEFRTPIDVITLGAALNELATADFRGTIHLAGNTRLNRYEMAKQIASKTGFPEEKILAINSNELPGRAPRPDDVSLNNMRARSLLKTPMLSMEEGLALTLSGKLIHS